MRILALTLAVLAFSVLGFGPCDDEVAPESAATAQIAE